VTERLLPLLRTTAFRLASIYLAAFVLAGALAAVLLLRQTGSVLTADALRAIATDRAELVEIARSRGLAELEAVVAERSRAGGTGLYYLGDGDANRRAGNLSRAPQELLATPDGGIFHYGNGRSSRLAAGIRSPIVGGAEMVVGRDIEDARVIADGMRRMFLFGLGLLIAAGLAGGILSSRHLLRRIDEVTATSRSIMAGDLSRRVPLKGTGDEIDGLAENLNAMLDRIEHLMAGMREVSDNIAHDLKTPLNRMRARIEAALQSNGSPELHRQGLERALSEADEIIRTFNALLLIARLEAGAVEESKAPFDIGALVRDVAELYEPVAEEKGLSLTASGPAPLLLHGNRQLVGQAVANLVDNAIKYAAGEGPGRASRVEIAARAAPIGIEISVADDGPGIPEKDRERALKRFVRLDTSRSAPGTGLGLSLVAAVARLHHASVRLEDNRPGLRVVLALPSTAGA